MTNLKTLLHGIIKDDGTSLLLPLFLILSILYGSIIRLRNFLYDTGLFRTRKLSCPVVSIGNITVGGTGKTPTVIALANFLSNSGFRPAILSRGYGGKKKDRINIVSDGENILMGVHDAGDEPVLMAKSVVNIPVITGKKRYVTGQYAIDHFGANVLILDDAFQHRSIARDIEIVLLDEGRPLGNGFMLPRGPLREPKDALKRADIVILTGTGENGKESEKADNLIKEYTDTPLFYRASRRPISLMEGKTGNDRPVEHLQGKKICAFSGIAEPENFSKTLRPLCGEIASFITFADHHVYTEDDIAAIRSASAESSAEMIITTEKDGMKLIDFPRFFRDIYLLRIEMNVISSGKEFTKVILERLRT
jgi:tetraacyldisaccharide 4'-kinase